MTYAERTAHEAIDEARRCEFAGSGVHSQACRNAAKAIEAAIVMCSERAYGHQADVGIRDGRDLLSKLESPQRSNADVDTWIAACRYVSASILEVAEHEEVPFGEKAS